MRRQTHDRWRARGVSLLLGGCFVWAALVVGGCRALGGPPVTEDTVDQELTVQPTPSTPPPVAIEEEPRPGFPQEPPKAQEEP